MKQIAVIGAGTMGNGIAHTFAQSGFTVKLIDISEQSLDRGMATIASNLDRMVAKGSITEADKLATIGNIITYTDIQDGVIGADLVVEAATENVNLKLDIFKKLNEYCSHHTILATNTSSISITQIGAVVSHPERVIGMHFMNPVPIMKLVVIIRGYNTSHDVTQTIMQLSEKLGKVPVEVNDYPGFVANRILMPMINESIETLYNGVAGVYEIDTVMKLGMAHPMGPLQLADFIGSTTALLNYTINNEAQSFIVVTETGIIHAMYKASPNKTFIPGPPNNQCACNDCPHMKLNTIEKLYLCLKNETPEIILEESIRKKAESSILRMLDLS